MKREFLKGIVSVKMNSEDTVVNDFKVSEIVIIKNAQRSQQNKQEDDVDAKAFAELEKD